MKWKNFYVWKKKLPHWRADSVVYFITFRHRLELQENFQHLLFTTILKTDSRKWNLLAISVSTMDSYLLVHFDDDTGSKTKEISKIIEPLKNKVEQRIVKGMEDAPKYMHYFYPESYDHIIRNREDLDHHLEIITSVPNEDLLWINKEELEKFFS